jgi:hypothetical protein
MVRSIRWWASFAYYAGSSATRAPARIGQGRAKVAKSEYRDLGEFLGLQYFFFY